jgi:hypothetical protein
MASSEFPRPLSDREVSVLDFMLSPDDPRLDALRDQVKRATVVGQWECCATIELGVEPQTLMPSDSSERLMVEARTPNRGDANTFFELLLFEKGGWLHTLELVHYGDQPPKEFPPADRFERPTVFRWPTVSK